MNRGLIIIAGAIANKAGQGGEAWVRLQWALGFQRLGHRVLLLEQLSAASADAVNYFRGVVDRFGLDSSLLGSDGVALHGRGAEDLPALAANADALINISGHLTYEPVMARARRRVFLDIDPGFTQFWHASGNPGARLAGHDFYFTIGENIGSQDCSIPTCGITWRKTRPPVVLDEWPPVTSPTFDGFATITNWRGAFGAVEFKGQKFGLKVHEFRKFIELPARTALPFEIALSIHAGDHKDLEALQRHGWKIAEASQAREPEDFRRYIQGSSAEFSVAQGIYVQTVSGWFSDRTAAYLASGKPALVQDTGFSRNLPNGEGLLTFRTFDEAADGAKQIAGNYQAHSRAARRVAEEYFDSAKVLTRLLTEIGL